MKKGVGFLVFFGVLFYLLSIAVYPMQITSTNSSACFPGCFIYTTIIVNETIPYATISFSGGSILSLKMGNNGTYIPFINAYYNFSENNTYNFETEVYNSGKSNQTILMNVSGYESTFNITEYYNIQYYKQKTINLSPTITDFDITKNEASILSSFNNNSGKVNVILYGNVHEYTSNITYQIKITLINASSQKLDFTDYMSIFDNDLAVYMNASLLDSMPRFIISISNVGNFLSGDILEEELYLPINGLELDAYYVDGEELVPIQNEVSQQPKIVKTQNSITIRFNSSRTAVISDNSFYPVINYINISDTSIHTGQIVSVAVEVNDSDVRYVGINDQPLLNITKYFWQANISIDRNPSSIYIVDKKGHSLYLENISFEIDDTAPTLYLYEPQEKVYYNEYVDLLWSSSDPTLISTYFYLDNGEYNSISGSTLKNGKYVFELNASKQTQLNFLSSGIHKIDIVALDNHSNERRRSSFFRINTMYNNTRFTKDVLGFDYKEYLNFLNLKYTVFDNNTNSTYNASYNYTYQDFRKSKNIPRIVEWNISSIGENVELNKDIAINIRLNETKYNSLQYVTYDIKLGFFGLDARWSRYFNISKSKENFIFEFKNRTNASIEDTIFIDNVTSFFLDPTLFEANITFPYPFLSTYSVLYYKNDTSTLPEKLNESKISKSSGNFTIRIGDFYGIIILKEVPKTKLFVDNVKGYVYDSFFNITGNAYSLSDDIFCDYEFKNFKILKPYKSTGRLELSKDISKSFSLQFAEVPDDYYKFNISCVNSLNVVLENYTAYFYVKDQTPPIIVNVRNVGPDTVAPYSFEDKTSLTLDFPKMTIFTNENSSCAFLEEDKNYNNMTAFGESNGYKHTTNLGLSKSNYTLFIRCIDSYSNEMLRPLIIHYTIKDKYIPPSVSIPSVGEGTNFNPLKGTGEDKIIWQRVDKNSILNINIVEGSVSFESIKLTMSAEAENISLTINISDYDLGYNVTPLYSTMKVYPVNFDDASLTYRYIYFKVLNSWLEKNKIKSEYVVLKEIDNNKKIITANTYKLRAASDYTYYMAESEYFNTYFITSQKESEMIANIRENGNGEEIKKETNTIKGDEEATLESQKIFIRERNYTIVFSLIIIFSLIIAIIFISRQMNQTPKQEITSLHRTKHILSELSENITGMKEEKKKNEEKKDENKNEEQND